MTKLRLIKTPFLPRAQFVGRLVITCPYCAWVTTRRIESTTFKFYCGNVDCARCFQWGWVLYVSQKLRQRPRDFVIPMKGIEGQAIGPRAEGVESFKRMIVALKKKNVELNHRTAALLDPEPLQSKSQLAKRRRVPTEGKKDGNRWTGVRQTEAYQRAVVKGEYEEVGGGAADAGDSETERRD